MENRLYVGNLPDDVSADALRKRFSEFGAVADVQLPTDRSSGRLRGHGFVTMENAADAHTAMSKLNGALFEEKKLRVNIAGERDGSRVQAPVTARITSQFRERLNMVYELDCGGIRLSVKMFPEDSKEEAWRVEGFVKGTGPAEGHESPEAPEMPNIGAQASAPTRAEALAELVRAWQEPGAPTGSVVLDWPAITKALAAVRAI